MQTFAYEFESARLYGNVILKEKSRRCEQIKRKNTSRLTKRFDSYQINSTKTSLPGHSPAGIFYCAGDPLLAYQSIGPHAVDVQHRKPSACDWALFRTGDTDSSRGYLDGPRRPRLVRLCCANLGNTAYGKVYLWSVFRSDFFHAGPPGRVFGWHGGFTKSEGGQPGLVLLVSLVFRPAVVNASHDPSGIECEPIA